MLSTKPLLLLLLLLSISQHSSTGEAAGALLRAGDVPLGRMGKPSGDGAAPRALGWDGTAWAGGFSMGLVGHHPAAGGAHLKVAAAGFGGCCVHQPSYEDRSERLAFQSLHSQSLSLSSPAPYAPSECCFTLAKAALRFEVLKNFYETSSDCLLKAIV